MNCASANCGSVGAAMLSHAFNRVTSRAHLPGMHQPMRRLGATVLENPPQTMTLV